MASLARQNGTLYLHVVQPNQWWQAAGDYQPIAADHIYGWVPDLVNKGYPAIVARTPALKAAGVEVLDATLLFKDLTRVEQLEERELSLLHACRGIWKPKNRRRIWTCRPMRTHGRAG